MSDDERLAVKCSVCGLGSWRTSEEIRDRCSRKACEGRFELFPTLASKMRSEVETFEAIAKALEPLDRDQARRVVLAIGELRGLDLWDLSTHES